MEKIQRLVLSSASFTRLYSQSGTTRPAHEHYAIEALEMRCLLSLTPVQAPTTIPFQELTIDPNPGTVPIVNIFADILGNGKLDVVTGHENNLGGGGIFWYEFPASGNPNDPWIKHTIDAGASTYEAAYPFDVMGKGHTDLIFSDFNQTVWYENPLDYGGDPRTDPWIQHVIGNFSAHEIYVTDLDGDGKPDIVTNFALYFQNSPDNWTTVAAPNFDHTVKGIALFDSGAGLGSVDVVGTGNSRNNITWWENPRDHGGNARTDPWIPHIIAPAYVPVGDQINDPGLGVSFAGMDVNGDGRMDIVSCGGEAYAPYPAGGLMWWEAPVDRINGTWIPHTIDANVELVHNIRIADMNGDGQPDLVIFEQDQSPQQRLMIVYNEGGTGQNWLEQTLATTGGHNEWVGDMTGDGDLDIVNSRHGFYTGINPIQIWVNGLAESGVVKASITSNPISTTVPDGRATFSVAATGTGPLAYQWERNGVDIPGATSPSYTLPAVSSTDDGASFRCLVSNARGFATSSSAILTVGVGSPTPTPTPTLTAALLGTPSPAVTSGTPFNFAVSYTDAIAINAASLGAGNLIVTGPDGYDQPATLISTGLLDSTRIDAAYSMPAPTVGGVYTVSSGNATVTDSSGGVLTPGTIGSFTISSVLPPLTGPDLTAAIIGKQPAAVLDGANGILRVRITNRGQQTAAGTISSSIFLTDVSSASIAPVSSDSMTIALKPQASTTVRLPFTYPADISRGNYRIGVTVNSSSSIAESDFTNNTAMGNVISMSPAVFTLTGTWGTVPHNLRSGRSAPVRLSLVDSGNIVYSGSLNVDVYASVGADGAGSVLVGSTKLAKMSIKPKGHLSLATKITPPAAIRGNAFLTAVVSAGGYSVNVDPTAISIV